MKRRPRVHLAWGLVPILVAVGIGMAVRGDGWWVLGIGGAGVLWFGLTWFLAPYSKWAKRMRQPAHEDFERNRERADRLERAPVAGRLFRLGRVLTGDSGRRLSEEYEAQVTADRDADGK